MVAPDTMAVLIKRLLDLNFPPVNDEGVRDLRMALEAGVRDQAAIDAVDEWVRYEKDCPKPAQIRKLVWEQNEKFKPAAAPQISSGPQCSTCRGFGVRESEHGAEITSAASFCDCSTGRQLQWNSPTYPADLNVARKKLLALQGMNTPLKRVPVAAGPSQDDGYQGDF